MDFQEYNIKRKEEEEGEERKQKPQELLKTTTTKRLYTVFALKIGSFLLKSNSRL